jgi:hypothetical protein
MRPYHVSSFVSGSPDGSETASVATVTSTLAGSEVALQAACLAWEAALAPKAELLEVVTFGSPGPSGTYRSQVTVPQGTVRIVSSRGSQLRSSSRGTSLFEATPGTGVFTLGATLIAVP